MFSCEFCSKELTSKFNLERHLKTCKKRGLEKEKYECDKCRKEFSTKWYYEEHIHLCKVKEKNKTKKEQANLRDIIKELKNVKEELRQLKEIKPQKVSYVQNVVNIHGLEPLDLSQERFDRIVEENYTYEVYCKIGVGKFIIAPYYCNDEGKPNVHLSDHTRMTMKYINMNNKVSYHKPFDVLCLTRNSKILEKLTQDYEKEYLKPDPDVYEGEYTISEKKQKAAYRSTYFKNEKSLLTQIKLSHIELGCNPDYKRLIIDPFGFDTELNHNAITN